MSAKFWVIFDTSGKAAYYLDVHKVLALPEGAIIRYDYSDYWLTPLAQQIADSIAASGGDATKHPGNDRVLLVYGQVEGFTHGMHLETEIAKSGAKHLWIPTRLGRLLRVSAKNKKYYFDIELLGYPHSDAAKIAALMASVAQTHPLAADKPNRKYVVVSDDEKNWTELDGVGATATSEAAQRWRGLVKRFHDETQFKKDSFWRLDVPKDSRIKEGGEGKSVRPKPSGTFDELAVDLSFDTLHDQELTFSIENHEPVQVDGTPIRRSIVAVADSSSVRVVPAEVELRPYAVWNLRARARVEELFGSAHYRISVRTDTRTTDWAVGPAFTVQLNVRRSKPAVLGGMFLGLAGAGVLFWASTFSPDSSAGIIQLCRTVAFVLGTGLVSASSYLLYRQLKLGF